MRKILVLTLALLLAFGSVSFAAVGGSKSSPRPSGGSTYKSTAPQTSPGSNYKPTAPANSYSNQAPTAQNKPGVSQPASQPSQGGFLRNAGLFGSGMLLGGLMSSMFGFGNMGFMASLFGMLFNVLILAAIFMAIRWVWNYFSNKTKSQRRNYK